MKTILAIINEPQNAKGFIQFVAKMAVDLNRDVRLLYIVNPEAYPNGMPGTYAAASVQIQKNLESAEENANKILSKYAESVLNEIDGDISIDYSSQTGMATLIAREYISDKKADMVMVENLDNDGFWAYNPSNMEIIRQIECPVWLIPEGARYEPISKVVYATDYREEDIATLKKLTGLTDKFSPEITAIHITDNPDFEERIKKAGFLENIQNQVSYDKIAVKYLTEKNDEDLAQLINDYALHIEAKLIVVLRENRSFLERIFKTDSTKKIIKHARLPVLVYHMEN